MPIRMSGLSSGLDTEALVSALVSAYSLKKDNLVKAQTKLSWKQDSWKTMNSSIYTFYNGSLKNARLSKTYNVKNSSISNTSVAKVTAAANAVNGTQTLKVTNLAATGYLTGGEVSASGTTTKVDKNTKLENIVNGTNTFAEGKVTVKVNGKSTDINLTKDMSVDDVISRFKGAGLNASFDETNQRFFLSSSTSGKDHDFSLTSDNAGGTSALKSMGLLTLNDSDIDEYKTWASYKGDTTAINKLKTDAYNSLKIDYDARAKEYATKYNDAAKIFNTYKEENGTIADFTTNVDALADALKTNYSSYLKMESGNPVKDSYGNYVFDTDAIKNDGKYEDFEKQQKSAVGARAALKKYTDAADIMNDNSTYVNVVDGKAVAATKDDADKTAWNKVVAQVDTENAVIKTNSDKAIDDKIAYSDEMYQKILAGTASESTGAKRVVGADAEIELNGATFKNNTNNFTINGLTIQVMEKTVASDGTDKGVTITTDSDVDGVYNSIKSMLKEYNTLIKSMDTSYNAASSKGYEPLTSAEKEAMTDDEVKEWEKKIKDSLLRKDNLLGNTASSMKNDMMSSFAINGKSYSLASFGIGTLDYFSSGENEKGVLHIDGDPDDTSTKGNDDKLRAAIANDPETVVSFFSQLATKMYTDIGNRMASSSMSSTLTIYNDKQMATEYSEYTTKIKDQTTKITTWEDYYYKKFTAMESALSKLNSQTSSLSGLMGS